MGALLHEQGLDVVEHRLRVKEERAVDLAEIRRQSKKGMSREAGGEGKEKNEG
jgi:hypothetical protein